MIIWIFAISNQGLYFACSCPWASLGEEEHTTAEVASDQKVLFHLWQPYQPLDRQKESITCLGILWWGEEERDRSEDSIQQTEARQQVLICIINYLVLATLNLDGFSAVRYPIIAEQYWTSSHLTFTPHIQYRVAGRLELISCSTEHMAKGSPGQDASASQGTYSHTL